MPLAGPTVGAIVGPPLPAGLAINHSLHVGPHAPPHSLSLRRLICHLYYGPFGKRLPYIGKFEERCLNYVGFWAVLVRLDLGLLVPPKKSRRLELRWSYLKVLDKSTPSIYGHLGLSPSKTHPSYVA